MAFVRTALLRVNRIAKAILQHLRKRTMQGQFQTQITNSRYAEYLIVHHNPSLNIARDHEESNVTTAHKLRTAERSAVKVDHLQTLTSTLIEFLRTLSIANTTEISTKSVFLSDYFRNATGALVLCLVHGILTISLDIRRYHLRQSMSVQPGTMPTQIRGIFMALCIHRLDPDCRFRQDLL